MRALLAVALVLGVATLGVTFGSANSNNVPESSAHDSLEGPATPPQVLPAECAGVAAVAGPPAIPAIPAIPVTNIRININGGGVSA